MTPIKVHLGAGDVYLKGYVNCDAQGLHASEATTSQLKANTTTLDKYFKYNFSGPCVKATRKRPVIVDCFMNALSQWPMFRNSVSEIVTISFIEHFSPQERDFILSEIERVLIPGGKWIVDFPDIEKTIKRYLHSRNRFIKTRTEWCMRLIYCHQGNQYSQHKWGYTAPYFKCLLQERNQWKDIKQKAIVKHDYPMISMICTKK